MFWLKKKDNEYYTKNGFRRCWFVSSSEEVFDYLKQNKQIILVGKKGRSFDFTTMYTNLPHEKIMTNVKIAYTKKLGHSNKCFLVRMPKPRSMKYIIYQKKMKLWRS